jgi:hypothetical protein
MEMNIEEEIGEEEPLKSTPEDEVFDQGEMGVGVMSGTEEESGKDLDGARWIISEQKGSKRCKTIPVQADRKSTRTLESDLSMTEKAAHLVASKNMEESGTFKSDHNNNFAILNSVSSDYLEKNALDSKIQFNPEFGSNIQQISVLQASELVQAKLAQANIKLQKELEERKVKESNIIVGAEHAGSSIQ